MSFVILGSIFMVITAGVSSQFPKPPFASVIAIAFIAGLAATTIHDPRWTTLDIVTGAIPWAIAGDYLGAYYHVRRWRT